MATIKDQPAGLDLCTVVSAGRIGGEKRNDTPDDDVRMQSWLGSLGMILCCRCYLEVMGIHNAGWGIGCPLCVLPCT